VIIVSPPTPPPEPGAPQIVTFSATPREARPGDLVMVVWEVKGAEVVRIEPFGEVPAIGRREHRPEATTEYVLVATNSRGQSAKQSEQVIIVSPPTPPPEPAPAGLIAFNSYRGNDTDRRGSRIFTIRLDGSALMQPGYDFNRDFDPVWSPDGRRILFSSYRHTPPDAIDYESFSEIYVMNVDGSDLRRLTDNGVPDWALGWSPDGNKIVFYSKPDWPDDTSYCFVMNADGGGVARLPTGPGNCTDPAWSPAGDRIAFYSNRDGDDEIYVANLDGSGLAQLTNNRARDFRPRWSRDGRRLVFVSERDGNAEVYTMNADGSDQQNRSNHPARDWFADWSPDGRYLVFASDRDGNDEIYRMNADGAEQVNLTNFPDADDQFPSWSWK
jgi:TolB protein